VISILSSFSELGRTDPPPTHEHVPGAPSTPSTLRWTPRLVSRCLRPARIGIRVRAATYPGFEPAPHRLCAIAGPRVAGLECSKTRSSSPPWSWSAEASNLAARRPDDTSARRPRPRYNHPPPAPPHLATARPQTTSIPNRAASARSHAGSDSDTRAEDLDHACHNCAGQPARRRPRQTCAISTTLASEPARMLAAMARTTRSQPRAPSLPAASARKFRSQALGPCALDHSVLNALRYMEVSDHGARASRLVCSRSESACRDRSVVAGRLWSRARSARLADNGRSGGALDRSARTASPRRAPLVATGHVRRRSRGCAHARRGWRDDRG
jgi:hypothetical protein